MINNHTYVKAGTTAALLTLVCLNIKHTGDRKATESNQDIKSGTYALEDHYCSSEKNNGTVWKVNVISTTDPYLF